MAVITPAPAQAGTDKKQEGGEEEGGEEAAAAKVGADDDGGEDDGVLQASLPALRAACWLVLQSHADVHQLFLLMERCASWQLCMPACTLDWGAP